jgi:hypothetical protein
MKEQQLSIRKKIIHLLRIGHKLLYIHFCELDKLRNSKHFKEYEQRLVDFTYDHYITKNLTKQQLLK